MAHGVFLEADNDLLEPYTESEDFVFLKEFLSNDSYHKNKKFKKPIIFDSRSNKIIRKYYRLGIKSRKTKSLQSLILYSAFLDESPKNFRTIAKLGLFHGLFADNFNKKLSKQEYRKLKEFVPSKV